VISAQRVEEIVKDCLYISDEIIDGKPIVEPIIGKGILRDFGFYPSRLESHREEVRVMLMELPDQFKKSNGGGWSFLNACMTKNDEQWGGHEDMERLFALGIGLGLVKFALPKDMWNVLPGGMPYITIED